MRERKSLWIEALLLSAFIGAIWYLHPEPLQSAPPVPVTFIREAAYIPIAGSMQKLTSLDTKQSLTVPTGARRCMLYVEDDSVRWNDDGTDPDPSTKVGGEIGAGQYFSYDGDLSALELKGSATTTVHVWYYGP